MVERTRRSMLAIGAAALTGGVLTTVGTSSADEQCPCPPAPMDANGWSSHRGTPANTAHVETDAFPQLETIAWEYERTGALAAVDDLVYVRTDDGEVHALDAIDGNREWKHAEGNATGTPAVADGAVYVAGDQLTALDGATGDVLWEMPFDESESVASPTVADEMVYVVAGGSLYAVDATDGSTVWQHDTIELGVYDETEDDATAVRSFAADPVAVANGAVYAPISPSGFVALDAASGDTLWTTDLQTGGNLVLPTADGVYVDRFEAGHMAGEAYQTAYEDEPEDVGPSRRQEFADPFTESNAFATSDAVRIVITEDGRHLKAWDNERDEFRWTYEYLSELQLFQWPAIAGDTAIVSYHPPSMSDDEQEAVIDGSGTESSALEVFGTEPAIIGVDLTDGSKRWAIPYTDLEGFDIAGDEFPYVVSEDALYLNAERLIAVRSSDAVADGETDSDASTADESQDGETEDETADETSVDERDSEADRDSDETDADLGTDDPENSSETEAANESESTGTANQSESAGTTDENDSVPGFTTGAGLVGGGLTLEWLRRRATTDESTE
ncbi:PQQ-binding-like beta-propeller repeat protein [Natronorubrum bangense]|uniref:Pyrrolo-quinoline quinone n=2 Tax=Natronorubrum bangense TaxID=61858 RepID=L9WNV9_9EURY|nr:PQQ-binding-like beta-propeller repeat protein [Natronorubrum bangense]ELY50008.1 pyrrolo-quinoline quinone [Natronorubrum bangense JCM 10635]QCC54143.1 pyrrolo-quinoline quinone [Natronorubrum bangense]